MADTNRALVWLVSTAHSVVAEAATAPFDRVKNLQQLQSELQRLGRLLPPDNRATGPVAHMLQVEGVRGLWRGFLPEIVAYFPTQSINFALRDYFEQNLFKEVEQRPSPTAGAAQVAVWFATRVASGALAGAASLLALYPLHLAQVQLMADVGRVGAATGVVRHRFQGAWDVWRQAVARHGGVGGLYHGLGASLAGVLVFRGLYFGLYDLAFHLLPARQKRHYMVGFLTAVGVTVVSALAAYPIDTVRRRVMVAALTPQAYGSALECAREIWQTEGLAGFFAGALSNVLVCSLSSFVLLALDQLVPAV